MERLVGIGEAAQALGVSITTLRRWEAEGKLPAAIHTAGGHRRYDLAKLRPEIFHTPNSPARRTVAYASVPGPAFRDELERQKQALQAYCAAQGWTFEVVADLDAALDSRGQGFQRLLQAITAGEVERLILMRTERLPRLGTELLFAVCAARNVEVVVLNRDDAGGIAAPKKRRKSWPTTPAISQPMPLEPQADAAPAPSAVKTASPAPLPDWVEKALQAARKESFL